MFESFKHYGVFLVIALLVSTVLLSNKAGVNLTHHNHTMEQLAVGNTITCSGLLFRSCSVRLTASIGERETYQEVLQLLTDASSRDTITFYLAGNGGQANSLVQLVNGIKNTSAHTIAVVEGDVYSAHADLAVATDELVVGKYINFIFHRSSAYGQEAGCDKEKGTLDRTQSMYDKCVAYLKEHLRVDEQMVREMQGRYLTDEEVALVIAGHDLIVSGDDMAKRTAKHGK